MDLTEENMVENDFREVIERKVNSKTDRKELNHILSQLIQHSVGCYTLCVSTGSIIPLALFFDETNIDHICTLMSIAADKVSPGVIALLKKIKFLLKRQATHDQQFHEYSVHVVDGEVIVKCIRTLSPSTNNSWVIVDCESRTSGFMDMDLVRSKDDSYETINNEEELTDREKELLFQISRTV